MERFGNAVALITPNGYQSRSIVAPYAVAVDASGNIWVPGRGIGTNPAQLLPTGLKGTLDAAVNRG